MDDFDAFWTNNLDILFVGKKLLLNTQKETN